MHDRSRYRLAAWWSGLRRPSLDETAWFNYVPQRPVASHRVRWSWWKPLGWIAETRYVDGSSSKQWTGPYARRVLGQRRHDAARPVSDPRRVGGGGSSDDEAPGAQQWVGTGSELWRVRVDLFVPDDSGDWVHLAAEGLRPLLTGSDPSIRHGDFGIDQGTGIANRPVVGLLFWVRADDVGQAALDAVGTARRALAAPLPDAGLYDVTVIPCAAVATGDPTYPPMHD